MSIEQEQLPQSNHASLNEPAFEEIKFFSPGSRINRLRYWAHSALMMIPFYVVLGIGAFLALKVSTIFWGIVVVAYIALIVFSFILIIQRLHDLDKSGWLSLLILVPLANLYLLVLLIFFKGTPERNTYGLPTPPNKTWHWILGLGLPIFFFVLGILAAIALPTYQNYALRAQQEQIQNLDSANGIEDDSVEEAPLGDEALDEEGAVDDDVIDGELNPDESEAVDKIVEDTNTTDSAETPDAVK